MRSIDSQNFLLLNRFGLGCKNGSNATAHRDVLVDLAQIVAMKGEALPSSKGLPTTVAALGEHAEFQIEARRVEAIKERDAAQRAAAAAIEEAKRAGQRPPPPYQAPSARIYAAEAEFRLRAALDADIGLTERLVWFWSNHFAISVAKAEPVRLIAGAFEREAIRPHVFGSFRAMLAAVEQHPAMLLFLDNRESVGPGSRAGSRRGRGLNENLARELLELHTLGADGGYTQADVTALAKALTGWTVPGRLDEDAEMGAFFFNPNRHEPGAQTIMGRTYPDQGLAQGRRILDDLARHPATARHIATKLVRHFIADEPPAELVAGIAKVFHDSDGDLAKVYIALIDASLAVPSAGKLRLPLEFVVVGLRTTGCPLNAPLDLYFSHIMGQPLWTPPGPDGFPDTDAQWATPSGMKTRLDVAMAIARGTPGTANPPAMLQATLGGVCSEPTAQAVDRAASRAQGLAILLMSPEIQRR